MYRILLDSVRLFILNVFLTVLFLEFYVLSFLSQEAFAIRLPFFGIFLAGIAVFVMIIVWLTVAKVMYKKIRLPGAVLARALLSEVPFVLLLAIFWLLTAFHRMADSADVRGLLGMLVVIVILFPLIMVGAKGHSSQVHTLEN